MRLLVVSQYYWPETFGINHLVDALVRARLQVTVLTGKPNYPDGKVFPGYDALGIRHEDHEGAEIVRVPLVPRGSNSSVRLAMNYLSFILSGYLLAPFLLRGRAYDAVFVYAPSPLLQALPAVLLAWLKRAPLVVWVQDLWPESLSATGFVRSRYALRAVEALVRHIYRHTDSILVQSEAFREPVSRLVEDADKIHYFPNSVDPGAGPTNADDGVPAELVAAIRNCFSVVFTGNVGTAQAVEMIVEAADRLRSHPNVRFFVVGSGSREGWLAAEIRHRNLDNIVLTGRLPATAMPPILAAASALLVTLRDEPIFAYTIPSKLQGYLAAGRPIIASMNGEGARVVVAAGAGIACAAGDSEALAKAVLAMEAYSPQQRAQLGENGRRYFSEHYDSRKLTEQLIRHLESLRTPGGGGGGMKVLVLGASGMLGNAMMRVLSGDPALEVWGTARSPAVRQFFPLDIGQRIVAGIDVENPDTLTRLLAEMKSAVLVNCIGLVKQLANADDPLLALPVNSLLPHRLARLCALGGIRLVHVSTDCVFKGTKGNYRESDASDAEDLYGKSKFLGEVAYPHTVTLRTSIIGHELASAHGLIDWFLAQDGQVKGYSRAIFSGLPTVELASVVRDVVLPRPEMTGIYHVASRPIAKLDLLRLVAQVYGKSIAIVPDDAVVIDRSLNADRFREATGYEAPEWPELVRRMHEFK